MKTLIIAEKPSVARDIASALNVPNLENDNIVINSCVGHLVRIDADVEKNAPLPIFPDFKLSVIEPVKEKYDEVKALLDRADIGTVVNACDAGREGELIFRLVYQKANCKKPIQRMWLQSMTKEAIKQAWETRKSGTDYDNLSDAAFSRSETDWLYGINGSRAVHSAVGRVMTPTLAMVVDRYEANQGFNAISFFEIHGTFKTSQGNYKGVWQHENKDARFSSKEQAQQLLNSLQGQQPIDVSEEKEHKKTFAPALFHLTSLQQVANKQLGLSAKKTLDIAQALYEKHKLTTYPRTDADALPNDYVQTVKQTLTALSTINPLAQEAVNSVNGLDKRIFNDEKISDHFAIIPTGQPVKTELSKEEQAIFDLIVKRFIAVFYPPCEYDQITRLTKMTSGQFKSTGKVIVNKGWTLIYNASKEEDTKSALVALDQGQLPTTQAFEMHEGKTQPPALYTEATLLRAMELAGKEVNNQQAATMLKGKGIGTPATRAVMIEKLKTAGKFDAYIKLDKKSLIPTQRGIDLIHYLRKTAPQLISAEMTGDLEYQLSQVEKGQLSRKDFMAEVHQNVSDLVTTIAHNQPQQANAQPIGTCPICKEKEMTSSRYSYLCDCGFKINKEIAGYTLKPDDLTSLLTKGKTAMIRSFKSTKTGKPFSALLKINPEEKNLTFVFLNKR